MEGEPPELGAGLYAALNLPRDAPQDQVKRAFRDLAKTLHPDKRHQGGAAERETAARRFAHVQEAYSVLSDPEKRDVYDVYGLEGLRAGLEVGHPLHRAEDIKREFRRFQEEQERERREQRVAYRGQYVFGFAVAPLVDSDPRPPQEQPVQILSSAMNTNASYAVTDADVLTVGGQAAVRGGLGGGNLFLAWRRQITALSTLDASAVVGQALSSTVTSSQRLSKHTRASLAATWQHRQGLGLALTHARQLTAFMEGELTYTLGPDSGVGLAFAHRGPRTTAAVDLRVGVGAVGVTAAVVRRVGPRHHARLAGKLGTMGIEAEAGAGKKIDKGSVVYCGVLVGIQGVYLKVRISHQGHKLAFPILLAPVVDWRVAVGAAVLPPAAAFVGRKLVVGPVTRYMARQRAQRLKADRDERIAAAVAAAVQDAGLLAPVVRRRLRQRAEKEGLVVVEGAYGVFEEGGAGGRESGEGGGGGEAREGEEVRLLIDVTVALNFLVSDDKLRLYDGIPKSGLMGFSDVAPGVEKELRVAYVYRGRAYACAGVTDLAPLTAPSPAHAVSDPAKRERILQKYAEMKLEEGPA